MHAYTDKYVNCTYLHTNLCTYILYCVRGFESHEHSVAAVASSLVVAVLHFLPQGIRPHVGQLVVLPCLKAVVMVGAVPRGRREVILPKGRTSWVRFIPEKVGKLARLHSFTVER